MEIRRALVLVSLLSYAALGVSAQTTSKPSETGKADTSKEASIIETYRTALAYENDGTGTRQISARVKVQSEAGVQQYGLLVFGYVSANEELQIDHVRVRKPDGSVIETPAETIQDMPSDVTRLAPVYSDYRAKHVAVRDLGVGDVLEYQIRTSMKVPLIPGQFWYAEDFFKDGIVLDQELEVSIPKDREVNVKSAEVQPTRREEGNRRIYLWKTENLARKEAEKNPLRDIPPPAVQLSTFRSWDEVGRWWQSLEQPQAAPTPEIRAKAAELTKDAKTESEKARAIYNYVSTRFRYVSISFGLGRYQPHAAAEVLMNSYGDCKDKVTLLASLLQAAGIDSYPALINSVRKIDPDVPSPAQFDHVISVVPQGKDVVWLDTTSEVAPYELLLANLRDKQALVIRPSRPATLEKTPAEPPVEAFLNFDIQGKLAEDGTLQAQVEETCRGDLEVVLRLAFRRVSQAQWKDLVQNLSYAQGFGGTVSNVVATTPENTNEPFRFSYDYTRKSYSDWTNRRIHPAVPFFALPGVSDEAAEADKPIFLGVRHEFHYQSKIELPQGYTPRLLSDVDLDRDYADYHSAYTFKDGVLTADRQLSIKKQEVPASGRESYRGFQKAVTDDGNAYTYLNAPGTVAGLPTSPDPEARRLVEQAKTAFLQQNSKAAAEDLERAVKADANYGEAWLMLGGAYMAMNRAEEGVDALRKAAALASNDPRSYWALAIALGGLNRRDEAIQAFRDLLRITPDNSEARALMAELLYKSEKYAEAAAEYEKAVESNPKKALWQEWLAWAYLQLGEADKAVAAFDKALNLDTQPLVRNNFAYDLADKGLKLDKAREYAEEAVREEEKATATLSLDQAGMKSLEHTRDLSHFWDTLGWICYLQGELKKAEKYLRAAWSLQQNPTPASHLGGLYEKQGEKEAAIRIYAAAVAADRNAIEAQDRLRRLVGDKARADNAVREAREQLSQERTVNLGKLGPRQGSAQFLILFSPGPKVEQVKFLEGPDDMRSLDKAIAAAKFDVPFPDDAPTRLVRRGTLYCSRISGCQFTLIPLEAGP
jgi:tetratricopeptide (TPR) repeat protein